MKKPGEKGYQLTQGHKLYTVKSGDTLWSISERECGGKGSAWKETIFKYNVWLIYEDRYNEDTGHVVIKVGEILDIYADYRE